jgi:hypothetical protein
LQRTTDAPLGHNKIDRQIPELMAMVDDLTYCSYRANRLRSPEVTPERWALIYHTVYEMEERFQKENHCEH